MNIDFGHIVQHNSLFRTYFAKGYRKYPLRYWVVVATYPFKMHHGISVFFAKRKFSSVYIFTHFIALSVGYTVTLNASSSSDIQHYLSFYSSTQYLTGHKKALKHLKKIPRLFPYTPLQISTEFILAWHTRNLKPVQNHLQATICAFARVEDAWSRLNAYDTIPEDQKHTYRNLYWHARLARAKAMLDLALYVDNPLPQQTTTNQRQLILQTAIDLLKDLQATPHHLAALYQIARAYDLLEKPEQAQQALTSLTEYCHHHSLKCCSELANAHFALGKIALTQKFFSKALDHFNLAEQAQGANTPLSPQNLDFWLHQGICSHRLGNYDNALALLSRVVNSPVASVLRIQAMCLRAQIYQEQGHTALATKQLQSIIRKGGLWKDYATSCLQKMHSEQ